ncbi:MAG TPA: hypothetical protein VJI69_03555 [Bacteroidia bacterium]|nr:hypothetical protein [Bacteroidia bacterium]
MKNLFTLIFFFTLSTCMFGQAMDCKKFKEGTFKTLPQDDAPETTIVRKGEIQKEKTKGTRGTSELIVKWIDDCTYTLTPTEKTLKKSPGLPKNMVLTVTITDVKEHSYMQTTTCNVFDFKLTFEIFKIK